MSDTPRTDAKAQFFGFNPDEGEEFVQIDFARELERENAALRAYLKTGDMPDPQWSKDDILHMYDLAIDERDAANKSLAVLHRENVALRADRERLDWLTDALDWVELGDCVPTDYDAEGRSRLDAWRLAIDAARKEKP